MMDGSVKRFVTPAEDVLWPLHIIKLTKAGLVQVAYDSPEEYVLISVPVKNVDLLVMTREGDKVKFHIKEEE